MPQAPMEASRKLVKWKDKLGAVKDWAATNVLRLSSNGSSNQENEAPTSTWSQQHLQQQRAKQQHNQKQQQQNTSPDSQQQQEGKSPQRSPAGGNPAAAKSAGGYSFPQPLQPGVGGAVPELDTESKLLTECALSALVNELPLRFRLSKWRLLYSTGKHGISLRTLYRRAASCGGSGNGDGGCPSVLVVRDFGGNVFGAFTPAGWKVAKGFFGTGETFVFQVAPEMLAWHWWVDRSASTATSSRNDYFMLGSNQALAVGGGGGRPAIWLDESLLRGSSGFCETFNSPALSSSPDFEVGQVELWGLV